MSTANPPEVLRLRTQAEIYAERISTAVSSIRRDWPHMLPTEAPAQRIRPARAASVGILGSNDERDDHTTTASGKESDIDPLTRILSLRRHTMEALNGWSRILMEDVPVTNSDALPLGDDVLGMCVFVDRWASWKGHQDDAFDCAEELEDFARRIHRIADPPRRERIQLGPCPLVVEGDIPDVYDRFCRGTVGIPIGGDEDDAECDGCEERAPLRWWEEVLGITRREFVRPTELAVILEDRLGVKVTGRTIRNWAREGRVTPMPMLGPVEDPETPPRPDRVPAYWFEVRMALDEVARMDRECPTCGRIWSGVGVVCGRCWHATHGVRAALAPERPQIVVGSVAPAPARLQICVLDERVRCEWSDLPKAWCACGRH